MKILKNNEWRDLTLKRAKEQLVELGVVLKHRDGKYVVRKRGSPVEYALGNLDGSSRPGVDDCSKILNPWTYAAARRKNWMS
jgi:hypothetical protein